MSEENSNGHGLDIRGIQQPGNGMSVKELVIRLEAKVDTLSSQMSQRINDIERWQSGHDAAHFHTEGQHDINKIISNVNDIREWQHMRQGNIDVLKVFFGTSVLGFILSFASLLVTIWAILQGGN